MKNLTSLYYIFLIAILVSCKKEKNYSLPPETQTGAGTFGCKINGKVWAPKGSDGYSGQNIKAYYQLIYPSADGYVFHISGTNYDLTPLEKVSIGTDSIKLFEGIAQNLGTGNRDGSGVGFFVKIGYEGTVEYRTNETKKGEFRLTKFDISNRIASGTFWFDAINQEGDLIKVTDGRFDVKFTR